MKTKTKEATRTGKGKAVHSRHRTERAVNSTRHAAPKSHEQPKEVCKHCGGMLRREPDGAVCVMCGRSADHKCDMCMHEESHAA
jgi:hypothetical protein